MESILESLPTEKKFLVLIYTINTMNNARSSEDRIYRFNRYFKLNTIELVYKTTTCTI